MGSAGELLLALAGFIFLIFLQGLKGTFLRGKKQLRQALVAQHSEDKKDDERRQHYDPGVDETSQTPPAGALRIVKNRFGHGGLIVHRMPRATRGQFSVGRELLARAGLVSGMHFPTPKMASNALYSHRAGTGAEGCSVLFCREPGSSGIAARIRAALSSGCRRFAALCGYRRKLAAAWRLRNHRFRPGYAYPLPLAGISWVSSCGFCPLRLEQLPRGSADSSLVRSWH